MIFINRKDIIKRKSIAISTWESPADPNSYIPVDMDVTKALPYIQKLNESNKEVKITMTHIVT